MTTEVRNTMIAKHALAVDDDFLCRNLHTKYLHQLGYEVQAVKDGAEVMKMYNTGNGNFDLILMDLEMHIINGDQVKS